MIDDFEHYAVTCFKEFGDKIECPRPESEPSLFVHFVIAEWRGACVEPTLSDQHFGKTTDATGDKVSERS